MKLTNLDIANIVNYLNNESTIMRDTTMKFTMEFAWKFKKNMKKLNDAYEMFMKLRDEIVQHYADEEYSYEDKAGQRLVKEAYLEEYYAKINELFAQVNDIEIDRVKIEKMCAGGLAGLDKFEISIPELDILSFMLDDTFAEDDAKDAE